MTNYHVLLTLLPLLLAFFAPHTSAAGPQSLNTITTPTLPTLNTSTTIDPPTIVIQLDPTHKILFSQYRHFTPERNYFAAIISFQTSLMAEYFEGRAQTVEPGVVGLDAYGAQIEFENPTGLLTYAMAHRMLGELGEFLVERDVCTARFELWQVQGRNARRLSAGFLLPEPPVTTAA